MGMTIEEALETIKGERWISCQEKYIEAINLITNTMRKYQKIEQIVKSWNDMNSFDSMKQISEVLEDGNDKTGC